MEQSRVTVPVRRSRLPTVGGRRHSDDAHARMIADVAQPRALAGQHQRQTDAAPTSDRRWPANTGDSHPSPGLDDRAVSHPGNRTDNTPTVGLPGM